MTREGKEREVTRTEGDVLEIGALVNVESGDELEEQAKKENGRGEKENK